MNKKLNIVIDENTKIDYEAICEFLGPLAIEFDYFIEFYDYNSKTQQFEPNGDGCIYGHNLQELFLLHLNTMLIGFIDGSYDYSLDELKQCIRNIKNL